MDPVAKRGQAVEQRWFVGAHADVGGGYPTRALSDIALAWMQSKATAAGLAINPTDIPVVTAANHMAPVTDSYRQFLDGAYALTHAPFYRPLHLLAGGNEVLDETVLKKKAAEPPPYHPPNAGLPP